jgi:hypothetical protein
MIRFGEVSVRSRQAFRGDKHLKRADAFFGQDLDGKEDAQLNIPAAKTAKTGETQAVFLTQRNDLHPLDSLQNLARMVPAKVEDPLFSWMDKKGNIRPLTRSKALTQINNILRAWEWGTAFGHSFRIGGASHYLAEKVDPEIIRIADRWRSLAYEVYI